MMQFSTSIFLISVLSVFGCSGEIANPQNTRSTVNVYGGCSKDLVDTLVDEKRERENIVKENKAIKVSMDTLKKEVVSMKKTFQSQIDALKKQLGRPIAFYAWLANENTAGSHQITIKYDRVVTNIGNGYDVNHGNFKVPVKGVYMFAVTVMDKKGSAHLEIMRNGKSVGDVRSESNFDTGSKVIILKLNVGDTVCLRNHGNNGLHSHSGRFAFNTFSGFLIRSM